MQRYKSTPQRESLIIGAVPNCLNLGGLLKLKQIDSSDMTISVFITNINMKEIV